MNRFLIAIVACVSSAVAIRAEPIDQPVVKLLQTYCGDCHANGASEGGLSIELAAVDWQESESIERWESIHEMVSRGIMPPPDADQPSPDERAELTNWIDQALCKHSPIGGTPLRRLNRREYAATIDQLFSLGGYRVPESFPPDNDANGFDNQGEALVVAGSHLEALAETATQIADLIFPPPAKTVPAKTVRILPDEMVISYSSALVVDGAMRLASSG
ncbi:MAG: DUF1587 domain-containing protein, partial [Pirellulaceae bacterium]|nr:DUF1587 domain-containing protein [Pirellulaceae bacterium]